jgi:hypothetical protein
MPASGLLVPERQDELAVVGRGFTICRDGRAGPWAPGPDPREGGRGSWRRS